MSRYLILVLVITKIHSCLAQENSTSLVSNDSNIIPPTAISSSSDPRDPELIEEAANTMFDEYWQIYLMKIPESATVLGDHRYDDKLSSYSLKSFEKEKVMVTEFLQRANELLPHAPEEGETRMNLKLFVIILQYKLDQLMAGSYLFPISKIETPEMNLRYLLKYVKLNTTEQYWNLIARYRAVPKQIDEIIELMREGIRTNYTLNENSVFSDASKWKLSADDSPFYKHFANISSFVPEDEMEAIQENASDAIMNSLVPAFQKLADFMENEYRPHLRADIGVGSLPNGEYFYKNKLAYHLTDATVNADEIHRMGLSEVARISHEMEEVIRDLGLNFTRQEFSNHLRNDSSQFFTSEEEALNTYREVIETAIKPKLPELFKIVPQKILTVEKIPNDMATGPRAYYLQASADNSTPATFFLDTSSLRNIPKYEVMTLAMHEGVPGHHFQISYAMEQNDFPDFRKYGFNSNAFIEGWALYAEYLGYELGLYEDPYQRYGHLSEEIFRACRMVVDTGMHVFGWSRQQAIDYMMENSAATLDNIEREVDRYITWPGQACAYKYGEMKIKELRRKAEAELGDAFDIKEFHDVILRNNGPMDLVAEQVDRHIAVTLASRS
ncbi:hypothetical protein X975_27171, partial [Stegodyphus mimosarum]